MSALELRHYSGETFELDRTSGLYHHRRARLGKPQGFWFSVLGDDDWPSWCRSEDFRIDRLAYEYRVNLSAEARLLTLTTVDELDAFNAEYVDPQRFSFTVHYERLQPEYDGILIAPYQWSRRSDFMWYSGWDCASGCIWNLEAIASLDLVKTDAPVGLS